MTSAPLYINEYRELRDQCRAALDRRREAYPAWIERGKIAADLAERDLRAWEALLAQWIWIADGPEAEGAALPPRVDLIDRYEAVQLALARIDQEIGRGNRGHDVMLQSHLVQALLWHLEQERLCRTSAVDLARLTHQCRADAAEKRSIAA